jgi:hypothetical protein
LTIATRPRSNASLVPLTAAERSDRIERYARGPALLHAAWERVPEAARKWRPGPERWSAHEVVCHCADSEANAALRIRTLVAEQDPLILGYDEAQWARILDYHALPVATAFATVDSVRAHTSELLRRLPEAAWSRVGRHTQSGRYGAEDWLDIYAEHLEKHARQIAQNVAAWNERPAPRE